MEKKITTKKPAAKKAAPRKRVVKKDEPVAELEEAKADTKPTVEKKKVAHHTGRYIFATGRRKTSVANVRLFHGDGDTVINKKPFTSYFYSSVDQNMALRPFALTGLAKDFYFVAHVNGGGIHSQAHAVSHGLARAIAEASPESRLVLKKNGVLTRDDRKKERKKPGLKRARRAPQWAKR